MFLVVPVLVGVAAAALAFAVPAAAAPCASSMDSVEYALEIAGGDTPTAPLISDSQTPCKCGGWRGSPCQCDVYCTCVPLLNEGHVGDFIHCSQSMLRINCPGAPLDQM